MMDIGKALTQNPYFGMCLTLLFYVIGQWVYRMTKWNVLQSILAPSLVIILILYLADIPFEVYAAQNQVLEYMLPLTAVVLAVPLYQNIKMLKRYWLPMLTGIVAGTVTTMVSLILIAKMMGTDRNIILSMIPKSATNPIAIQVSDIIGGVPSLTVALVVIAGIFGGSFGPEVLNIFRVKNKIARGVAIGSMSHAVGTCRAFLEGPVEGTMSSLALAIAGTLTAFLSPIFVAFFL